MDNGDHKYFIKSPQNMEAARGGNKEMELAVFTHPSTSLMESGQNKLEIRVTVMFPIA